MQTPPSPPVRSSSFQKLQEKLPQTESALRKFGFCGALIVLFGFIFIIAAAVTPPQLKNAVNNGLKSAAILSGPSATSYDSWVDDGQNPLVLNVYMLDLVNPLETLNGEPPALIERGPYVYYEHRRNFNVSWTDDGNILHYEQFSQYTFQPQLSVEDDSVLVTSLNMPFQALLYSLTPAEMGLLASVYQALLQSSYQDIIFTKRPVRELLFGYQDPALSILAQLGFKIPSLYPGFFNNFSTPSEAVLSGKIGENIIATGLKNLNTIRNFYQWNNMTSVRITPACTLPPCPSAPLWATDAANQVRGSDGSQFPPPVSDATQPVVWLTSFYRAITLTYTGKVTFKGINLLRFQFPDSFWLNSTLNPANAAYYQNNLPCGLFNISAVVQNTPSYFSNPRFINADPSLMAGLRYAPLPNLVPDLTAFDVEPYSGASFRAIASSQFNVHVAPVPGMSVPNYPNNKTTWFPNLRPVYFPVFWASEQGAISDDDASTFKTSVYGAIFIEDMAQNLGYPFGGLFLVFGGIMVAYVLWMKGHCGEKPTPLETANLLGPSASPDPRDTKDTYNNYTPSSKTTHAKNDREYNNYGSGNGTKEDIAI